MKWGFIVIGGLAGVNAHSWLDCTDRREDGSCGGYIRNFQGHHDDMETYKILDRNPATPLCDPRYQGRPDRYPGRFPMAQAKAGQRLYFDYFENGHITVDQLPPDRLPHPGYYAVYWTGVPFVGRLDDGSQLTHRGDLRHLRPLETKSFDDGVCADTSVGGRTGPTPCLGGYSIPNATAPGIYQFAWVWHYHRDSGGLGEEYTSCFDVAVLDDDTYDQFYSHRIFPPHNPLVGDPLGPKATLTPDLADARPPEPVNCGGDQPGAFDPEKHACLDGGTVLCPLGYQVCGRGQCYSAATHQCCFDTLLLPANQQCHLLANPFHRLKHLIETGY